MSCVLRANLSILPVAELSIRIYTPATDGVVAFVVDPVHEIARHLAPLVVHVELVNVNEGGAFPRMSMSLIVKTFLSFRK